MLIRHVCLLGVGSGSSAQFKEESFSKRVLSIKKYVKMDKELQLRVLYALQIAVAKLQHPPGEWSLISTHTHQTVCTWQDKVDLLAIRYRYHIQSAQSSSRTLAERSSPSKSMVLNSKIATLSSENLH